MIDFHSHILPGVDDGSASIDESIGLLHKLKEQGVGVVCATPHFIAAEEDVDSFLERRNNAYEQLKPHLDENCPEIILGAEVAYYEGVARLEGLDKLRLEGTKLLLLEMPFKEWSAYSMQELKELSCRGRLQLVLAHVERYMAFEKSAVWDKLLDYGILMQVNASFFLNWRTKGKALKLLDNGSVHVIGSDCHNLEYRPPRMGEAAEVICKKYGDGLLREIDRFGRHIIRR